MENVAAFIGDPVRRLRFLRAVAPVGDVRARRRPRLWTRAGPALFILLALLAAAVTLFRSRAAARPAPAAMAPHAVEAVLAAPAPQPDPAVWRVDTQEAADLYSNGLRIDNTYAVSHHARSYLAFPIEGGPSVRRAEPAGIVFHSTESMQVPFEAGHNDTLKQIGESLLTYVRRNRSYHFLIDRFGRVYRVVAENDAANHAGHSAWADDRWLYLNLNDSFFGVAFESQAGARITAAQLRSAVVLTEMLRSQYRIAATDCVTHAQVSVNPSNMRIGYHIDWASGFPFAELGLPDNYLVALPAIWAFGFECDPAFWNAGDRMRRGVEGAIELVHGRAAAAGLPLPAYRRQLQQRYREMLASVH